MKDLMRRKSVESILGSVVVVFACPIKKFLKSFNGRKLSVANIIVKIFVKSLNHAVGKINVFLSNHHAHNSREIRKFSQISFVFGPIIHKKGGLFEFFRVSGDSVFNGVSIDDGRFLDGCDGGESIPGEICCPLS